METNNTTNLKSHRRLKSDSMMSYSLGSMSYDFLGDKNVLGSTFDELEDLEPKTIGIENDVGEDVESTLAGSKHLRSFSFNEGGDTDVDNDVFVLNANGTSENGPGVTNPQSGVPYRHKKVVRGNRAMTSATAPSNGAGSGSHRRVKSMSSASTDQMILECFRRDPSISASELPDLGSMSMESSDILKCTSEDWHEAFVQIGDSDISSPLASGHKAIESNTGLPMPPPRKDQHTRSSNVAVNGSQPFRHNFHRSVLGSMPPPTGTFSLSKAAGLHDRGEYPIIATQVTKAENGLGDGSQPSIIAMPHNGNTRSQQATGIADAPRATFSSTKDDYNQYNKAVNRFEDQNESDKKTSRGKYRCGRCGQPKVNHDCPYEIETSTRSVSIQACAQSYDDRTHPFISEKTIVVKRQPTSIDSSKKVKVNTQFSSQGEYSGNAGQKSPKLTEKAVESVQSNKAWSPSHNASQVKVNPKQFTRSGSSGQDSVYNDIIKDIRIVHPSMQNQAHNASASSDESDSNSLFLSSLSSSSAATDDN